MVSRSPHVNPCEFAVVSGLRAHQLMDGCLPQLDGEHNAACPERACDHCVRTTQISSLVGYSVA